MNKRLLSMLVLLLTATTGAWAQDYYAPSTDEVIILNEVYNASNSGYSSHSAIAWGGSASTSNKRAGDPNNGGQQTSKTVSCYSVKGTGQGKNITLSITGVSKVIVYHESHASRYIELRDGSKTGNIIGSGQINTYYTEVALTATNEYSIFLHGTNGSSDQDFYVYAIKLIAAADPAPAPVATGYTVSLADGTVDAGNWSIEPKEGLSEGDQVTIQYTGRLKVKSVKATSDAEQADPLAVPMTIEAITAGAIKVSSPKEGMQYSLDGGKTKNAVTTDDIVLNVGDKVQFYGNGTSITSYNGTIITSSGDGFTCKVYGNIMSLVDEENFATATTLSANNTFKSLFYEFNTLTDASGLLLPATQLAASCYYSMFQGCTALTAAPALPATTLVESCYFRMFFGCTALTAAPALPATQLASYCYYSMFQGCASLTTAPALPAMQLASNCYRLMFSNCTALTASPVLPAETLVSYCYNQMFYLCSKLATVTCLATSGINQSGSTTRWLGSAGTQAEDTKTIYTVSTADWTTMNDSGIPDGWTRVNVDN